MNYIKVNNKELQLYNRSTIFVPASDIETTSIKLETEDGERVLSSRLKNKDVKFNAIIRAGNIRTAYNTFLQSLDRKNEVLLELEEYPDTYFVAQFTKIEIKNFSSNQAYLNVTMSINPISYIKTTEYATVEALRASKSSKIIY